MFLQLPNSIFKTFLDFVLQKNKTFLALSRMYKGLEQQPTFIFSECSDVTEAFVLDDGDSRITRDRTRSKARCKMTTPLITKDEEVEDCFPPKLPSSATSIIQHPSSALVRHSPFQNFNLRHGNTSFTEEPLDEEQDRDNLLGGNKKADEGFEEKSSYCKRIRILRELSAAKRERARRTEEEFLQFAKDFARKCRMRPIENLLNPVQYDNQLQTASSQNKIANSFTYGQNDSLRSKFPFVRSSSLIGLNSEDVGEVSGHVVGDLFSFASNMARYLIVFLFNPFYFESTCIRFFDTPDLSDVILVVGDHRFYAHKFALAAQSEVFHEMLLIGDRSANCPDYQKVSDK